MKRTPLNFHPSTFNFRMPFEFTNWLLVFARVSALLAVIDQWEHQYAADHLTYDERRSA